MAFNRLLPYRELQTRHLRLLLGTARVFAWIGMLLVAGGIAWGIMASWLHLAASTPYQMMSASLGLQTTIGLIGYGLLALALSGALAALIGIEESQRRRVEKE